MSLPSKGRIRYNFDVDKTLRDEFSTACSSRQTKSAIVLRQFMAQYVLEFRRDNDIYKPEKETKAERGKSKR